MVVHVLNVAEKPSVAKSVAEILSRGGLRSRMGRSRYNRIYEFDYSIQGQQCHMLVTSVTGHLMELDFDERDRKWHSCDPADLFSAPLRKFVPEDKSDIKMTLEEESRKCQWLVLWLDCDREGENIAFEVIEVCTAVNRYLNIWRARFSALIDREIHHSVQNLVQPNKLFADAVDARQEIDLRIGASFTRFQTLLLKDAFVLDFAGDDRSMVLSYGPCQFPTLGFIVERYWEIQAHEPEEFWTINCSHVSDEGTSKFDWMRGHLFDYTAAVIIYEMCVEDPTATVVDVRNQERLKYPPYPLSTVELQKRASKYFRMSSDHTMKVAEELYQAGYISYPRTETDNFSPNTDLHAIAREQVAHPSWGTYAQRLLDPEARLWRNPSNGGHDDKAHPPIHPTRFSSGEPGWSQDHNRLYELVVRHFLACVSQPAVGAETKVEVDIAGEKFSASGRAILAKNYLDVYRFDSWGGSVIPTYNIGQQFLPTSLTLDSGVTRPPPLLSESDLLSRMDEASIGTDATMHDHIKKCLDRYYATKDSNTRFSPTNLGEALVMGYDDMGYELWKPFLRAAMEQDMRRISVGEKMKSEVLETCLQQMKACFLDARRNKAKLMEAMENFFERSNRPVGSTPTSNETVSPCDACHESNMVLRRNMNGSFMVGCSSYPMCRNVVWLPGSLSEAAVTNEVCPNCSPGPVFMVQFKFRRWDIPPDYDVNHLGCVRCDVVLKELTEICGTGPRVAAGMTGRGHRTMDTPASIRRGTAAADSCTYCREIGHLFMSCPYNVSSVPGVRPTRTQDARNDPGRIICNCEEPCRLQTANTESNRGRKFYSCRQCNFFVWEDSLESRGTRGRGTYHGSSSNSRSSTTSSVPRRGRRGRGQRGTNSAHSATFTSARFVSATGEPVPGACYTCGDPSHFANACPSRGG